MTSSLQESFLTDRFVSALQFAHDVHRSQIRKDTTVPYVSHLLSVAGLVLESGGDEDLAIAGLLHDAVEDAEEISGEEMSDRIRSKFGGRVADIVDGCSDAKSSPGGSKPPWRSRKEAYIKHLRSASDDVLRVSIADKVHNARSIATDQDRLGAELWTRFSSTSEESRWYYTSLRDIYKERISDSYLIKELDIAIARIWPD
ncbi:MAG: HD domain-containing protein [Actinobacteria bacterium]|nr:HD domain-containing protein [Actinomycetota bacterium]